MSEVTAQVFIDCRNMLGEGPIWHSDRQQLFWFDISNHKLYCANATGDILDSWEFDEYAAAAAVVDANTLLIFTATKLVKLDLETGERETVLPVEADNAATRSNDSRVNFAGGFWLGTMGVDAAEGAGSVYQFRDGTLTTIMTDISIPNATCFTPDGKRAYWGDTKTNKIITCTLDPDTGLPNGPWETHIDTSGHRGSPDGAVLDSEGYLWSARWGGGCVVRHAPDGSVDRIVEVPGATNITCPCFGGPELKTLYITTAREGLSEAQLEAQPHAGSIFSIELDVAGLPENRVRL